MKLFFSLANKISKRGIVPNLKNVSFMSIVVAMGSFIFSLKGLVVMSKCLLGLINGIVLSHLRMNLENKMVTFAIMSIVGKILCIPDEYISSMYTARNRNMFIDEQWRKYAKLDQISREKDSPMTFNALMEEVSYIVGYRATSTLSSWVNTIFTVFGVTSVLIQKQQIKLFLLLCGMNIINHFAVTKFIGNKVNKMIADTNSLYKEEKDSIQLEAFRIHTRENRHSNMMNIKTKQSIRNQKIDLLWSVKNVLNELPNKLVYLAIPFVTANAMINPVVLSLTSINNIFSSLSTQMSNKERDKSRMVAYEKFWDGKTFNESIPQVNEIPQIVSFGGDLLGGKVHIPTTSVTRKDRIHVAGPSGGGKTSMLRGLIGYISGINFENGAIPGSYASRIAYMRQDMTKTTPFTNTTLRQLFYDEFNNDIIIECLQDANITKWFVNEMESNLDKQINNKLSGGQETRLCIAITMYLARTRDWVFLDEPERGLDPEDAADILDHIFTKYQDKTFFIVSHLCECVMKNLKTAKKWEIDDGELRIKSTHVDYSQFENNMMNGTLSWFGPSPPFL